ncbi:MAG: hypothetical protein ACP5XB_18195 [Isosphaeraceae bacterium]
MLAAVHQELAFPKVEERFPKGELTNSQADAFREFLDRVQHELFRHRVITDNAYTHWFRDGQASHAGLRHFVRQFSVFSNQFLVAALLRVIEPTTPCTHGR